MEDKYMYCSTCMIAWKNRSINQEVPKETEVEKEFPSSTKLWDKDPLVSVFLQINSNLGNIAKRLQNMERIQEYHLGAIGENTELLASVIQNHLVKKPKIQEVKGMRRSDPSKN